MTCIFWHWRFGHRIAISIPSGAKQVWARHGTAAGGWRLEGWEQATGSFLCLMFYALLHGYKFLLVATTPQMSIYMMTTLRTLSSRDRDPMGGVASWLPT